LDFLAEEYNRPDHPDLKIFLKNDIFYKQVLVPKDIPSKFNMLTPMELSQLMSHIQSLYRKAARVQQTSGNHCPTTKNIGARPRLFLYDKCLQELLIKMKAFFSGDLPDGVGGSSLKREKLDTLENDTNSGDDSKLRKKK
jgi:hypothetical protein